MAGSTIKKDDVLAGVANDLGLISNSLDEAIKSNEEYIISVTKLLNLFKGQGSKELKEFYKNINLLNEATNQHQALVEKKISVDTRLAKVNADRIKHQIEEAKRDKELEKLKQEKLKTTDKEIQSEVKLTKAIIEEAKNKEKLNTLVEKEAEKRRKANSAYSQADRELKKLRDSYKDLATRQARGIKLEEDEIKSLQKLEKEINNLDKILKKVDASAGQHQRSVGNYKEAIKEAFQETGLLNGRLGEIANTLNGVKNKLDEARKSGEGFGTMLKITGVGLAIAAVKALSELVEINQKLSDGLDILKARAKDAAGEGFENLVRSTISFRKELRQLNIDMQKARQDQEDFSEIANDATLGFKTREEFAKKALAAELERSSIAIKIAEKELDLANKEISARESIVGVGNATNDLLDKRTEAQLKLNDATDSFNDATRISLQQQREIQEKQLKQTINAIQAETQIKIDALNKQVDNEKKQIEERRKLAAEGNDISRKAFNQEIKQFGDILNVRVEGNRLLQISDGELLQAEIEKLNLGVKAQKELLDIIQLRQKAKLDFAETNAQLDDAEIQRTLKIQEIQRQIVIDQQNFIIDQRREDVENATQTSEDLNNKILDSENVFNSKLLKARRDTNERIKEDKKDLLTEQNNLLDLERENELMNAELEITDSKILAEEKLRIEQEYQNKKIKLNSDAQGQILTDTEKTNKQEQEIRKKQIAIIANETGKLIDALDQAYQEERERQDELFDKQIDRRQKNVDQQRELFEKGQENSLARQEALLAKEEQMKIQAAKKQEIAQLVLALSKAYLAYVEQDPNTALRKATFDVALLQLAKKGFGGSFYEGTESLGESDSVYNRRSPKDPYLIWGHPGERIISADKNLKIPEGMSNDEVVRGAIFYKHNFLSDFGASVLKPDLGQESFGQNVSNSIALQQASSLMSINNRLQSLEKTIADKPEYGMEIDGLLNLIQSIKRNGNVTKTKFVSGNKTKVF